MAGGRKREWMRKKVAAMMPGSGSGPPQWAVRVRAISAALRRGHRPGGLPHVDVLALLYENMVFYVLWALESVLVVAKLCFFYLRFGFRL